MRMLRNYVMVLGLVLGAAGWAWGEAPQAQAPTAAPQAAPDDDEKDRNYFTDLPVVTQDGQTLRFYSDVLKGNVVVISFIFTNCPDACPLITNKLVQTRAALGDGVRDQVRFISLSVDTDRDTPEAMKKFAQEQGADQPNWLFLTGEKQNLQTIIRRLGQYTDTVEAHSTMLIAGNVPQKRWSKIPPMIPPSGVAMRLTELAGAF